MKDPLRILIIDDEKQIRFMLSNILSKLGYAVMEAANGVEGLEKIKEMPFDLVISDVRMPEMDGITVLREVKKIAPAIEVIMISGYSATDAVVNSLKIGAFDFINKPFDSNQISATVEKATASFLIKQKFSVIQKRFSELGCSDDAPANASRCDIEKEFYELIENSSQAIVSLDTSREISNWNNGARAIFGYTAERVKGKSIDFLYSYSSEMLNAFFWDEIDRKGIVWDFITRAMTAEKETIYVVTTAFKIPGEGIAILLRKSKLIVY
ncbi:MAG: hypothetical protein A2219_07155 [Elusimicrobia bacterium RIFOXYA2_FULL_50_26]|nr:MAG: hypothetical protein A2219_07155 [Elusimicrobia bacterium RIFOXYA2_FULL_50_26]OGS22529.1 MAG: hypothetical protein A2314_08520 [Elusimicrobia bacterium RIFOXYB2_FULL_50_12]